MKEAEKALKWEEEDQDRFHPAHGPDTLYPATFQSWLRHGQIEQCLFNHA